MLQVVDSSLVVKWFIPEPHSDKAIHTAIRAMKLLADFRTRKLDLTAPDHLAPVVASALWKRSTLRREISVAEAADSYDDFWALELPLHPASSLVGAALRLAAQARHSVYDMLYIVLAEQRGCQFITADETLVRKLSGKFPFVRLLGDL
jgi:predicted nucleic acid-binding protein